MQKDVFINLSNHRARHSPSFETKLQPTSGIVLSYAGISFPMGLRGPFSDRGQSGLTHPLNEQALL